MGWSHTRLAQTKWESWWGCLWFKNIWNLKNITIHSYNFQFAKDNNSIILLNKILAQRCSKKSSFVIYSRVSKRDKDNKPDNDGTTLKANTLLKDHFCDP